MNHTTACCRRGEGRADLDRGVCPMCWAKARQARKEHTTASALNVAYESRGRNLVGALRLVAWAMHREVSWDLRFEQGPAACAALLRP